MSVGAAKSGLGQIADWKTLGHHAQRRGSGLATGGRATAHTGLRREEVALLAGVGVTWYTWLEHGRQINASMQVLDAVARTLRLDRVEREHLYRLAEATPLRTECARLVVPDTIREIVHSLEPLPASRHRAKRARQVRRVRQPGPLHGGPAALRVRPARRRPGLGRGHPPPGLPEPRVRRALGPSRELNLPGLPEARIVVYTPRDDDTRTRMPLTRRHPAATHVPATTHVPVTTHVTTHTT